MTFVHQTLYQFIKGSSAYQLARKNEISKKKLKSEKKDFI